MALNIGSITVDGDGVATGDGLSFEMYEGAVGALSDDVKAQIAGAMKPFCEGMAAAIINHITANAEIEITIETSDSGLQRTPDPNAANTDCQGPSTEKTLSGTIA